MLKSIKVVSIGHFWGEIIKLAERPLKKRFSGDITIQRQRGITVGSPSTFCIYFSTFLIGRISGCD